MDAAHILITLLSGGVIGFVLGLVGGGGSILAVPLLVYAVGMKSPHMAIGTAAVAVALNALVGLIGHARAGNVRWQCALSFALAGSAGAALGAEAGKAVDGESLLGLFGGLMVVVALLMLRGRTAAENPLVRMTRENAKSMLSRILPIGFGTGLLAGFFGIRRVLRALEHGRLDDRRLAGRRRHRRQRAGARCRREARHAQARAGDRICAAGRGGRRVGDRQVAGLR